MKMRVLVAGVALTVVGFVTAPARAGEAPPLGISVDAYLAPAWDSTVTVLTAGAPQDRGRGLVGLTALGGVGDLVAGGLVDGFPGIFGDGRMTVGGLIGWQPWVRGQRLALLGEVGGERFSDVGGNFFTTPSVHETWLRYVGARLGAATAFGPGRHIELGAWAFVRRDLDEATVTNTSSNWLGNSDVTTTAYRLGGTTVGVALRIGLRFDQKRTSAPEARELAFDR